MELYRHYGPNGLSIATDGSVPETKRAGLDHGIVNHVESVDDIRKLIGDRKLLSAEVTHFSDFLPEQRDSVLEYIVRNLRQDGSVSIQPCASAEASALVTQLLQKHGLDPQIVEDAISATRGEVIKNTTGALPKTLIVLDPELGHVTVQVRGLRYQELFQRDSWPVVFANIRELGEDAIIEIAAHFDVVYLLKVASFRVVDEIRRRTNAKVIFDLTDALWLPIHRTHGWNDLERILLTSHAIFSENEFVCEYGLRYNKALYSIPAGTNVELFEKVAAAHTCRPRNHVRIGWVGSSGTVSAIAKLAPVLRTLATRYPSLEVRIIGCKQEFLPDLSGIPFTFREEYDEHSMIEEILDLDIGIFPPPNDVDDFRIRGSQKALLYMTGGVPPVTLRAGDCERFIDHGRTGLLVTNDEEWLSALDTLIQNPELRKQLGDAARQDVRVGRSTEQVFDRLCRALRTVHEGES